MDVSEEAFVREVRVRQKIEIERDLARAMADKAHLAVSRLSEMYDELREDTDEAIAALEAQIAKLKAKRRKPAKRSRK